MNEKVAGFLKGKRGKIVVILGLAGMTLILFSELFSGNEQKEEKHESTETVITEYEDYVSEMENRLEGILEKINGVGNADVMITAAGSAEYIYARNEKTETDGDDISKDEEYVIIGGSGEKKALVRKVSNPEIMGIVVICEGGGSNIVKEKVYSAVAAAFNIPSQKIFVTDSM